MPKGNKTHQNDSWAVDPFDDEDLFLAEGKSLPEPPISVISQQTIAEFIALKEAHHRFEAIKRQLKSALQAGAVIEPGPHGLKLSVKERNQLTVAYLIEALGLSDQQVIALRDSAPMRRLTYLRAKPG